MADTPHTVLAMDICSNKIKHLLDSTEGQEASRHPWCGCIQFHRLNIKHDSRLEELIKMSDLVSSLAPWNISDSGSLLAFSFFNVIRALLHFRDSSRLEVLGSRITDVVATAIVSSYTNLELLDLSGSSITDSGIRMICNVFPKTLCRLLLALCQNVTSSGIQFAAAKLPLLQLIDCGMSICHLNNQY